VLLQLLTTLLEKKKNRQRLCRFFLYSLKIL